jgi:hypothetical protein
MKKQPQQPEQQRSDYSAPTSSGALPDTTDGGTRALRDVAAERARQINAEGWTEEHDDRHDCGEMANAAACYALNAGGSGEWRDSTIRNRLWPWCAKWWKPKQPRRDLVRAGALILAEIERLDRATVPGTGQDAGSEPEQNKQTAVVRDEPEGWVSVPLEPTEEMVNAAYETVGAEPLWTFTRIYKAMLAAKPSRG